MTRWPGSKLSHGFLSKHMEYEMNRIIVPVGDAGKTAKQNESEGLYSAKILSNKQR